jgi:hypothetical protein
MAFFLALYQLLRFCDYVCDVLYAKMTLKYD